MKIIATGDWHLGNMFHGYDRLPEHKHFLDWLLRQIKHHRPDALVVAGDVFDTANPSAAAQGVYYEFLASATKQCPDMLIVITAGNHDSASRLDAPRTLLKQHRIEVRGKVGRKWVDDENGGRWITDYDDLMIPIEGSHGTSAVILAVPYLRYDVIQDADYEAGVNKFLKDMTGRAREKWPDAKMVMMAHMYAKGADIAAKDASEKIVIGGQEEISIQSWEDRPDYLTCGHIHKRQSIRGADWARYPGSILPMSFAETDYVHGVDLVEITEDGSVQVKFLEYSPQHVLKIIPKDDAELTIEQIKKLLDEELPDRTGEKPGDDFVYLLVKVRLDKISNDEIKKIEKVVERKNAVLCKIQKMVPMLEIDTFSDSSAIKSIDDILERDPLETLKDAFLAEHKFPMSAHQEQMLKTLLESNGNIEG